MSYPSLPVPSEEHNPPAPMGFGTAVVTCLRKAVRARGRASLAEFWYFALFCAIVFSAGGFLGAAVGGGENDWLFVVLVPYWLLLVPWTTAGMRRLHDTGRGGGWCFLIFFPVLGWIVLLVLLIQPSQPHANRYGP